MTANPDQLDTRQTVSSVPKGVRHVGVIMDGNGRWAQARGLKRSDGHKKGLETLRRVIRHAGQIGLEYITIYSFSSENWNRPETEVSFLMSLLRRFVQQDLSEIHHANVKILVIGERDSLEPGIRQLLTDAEELTESNTGMTLIVAFNYGARDEIARTVRHLARDVAAGTLDPETISPDMIGDRLDTAGVPDPDLIIRTSGEQRLSNFLMWQAAYSEFYFCQCHWPDFDEATFDRALDDYAGRERRFGGLKAKAF